MKKNAITLTPGTTIIAHGDGDGTIAAAICRLAGANGRLITTQPFGLAKLADLTGPAVVVDIAVDNKSPQATLDWASRNAAHITLWFDHHTGSEPLAEILGERFVYDPTAPSCPTLMAENGFGVPVAWVEAANACDRPTDYAQTALSTRYNSAFTVALVALQNGDRNAVETVQAAFIEELVTGELSPLVSKLEGDYPVLEATTLAAIERIEKFYYPEFGSVEVDGQGSVDMTSLLIGGYKKYPTVIVPTISADNEKVIVVGTNKKDLNLVKIFNLGSGNPSRILLTGNEASLDYVKMCFGFM